MNVRETLSLGHFYHEMQAKADDLPGNFILPAPQCHFVFLMNRVHLTHQVGGETSSVPPERPYKPPGPPRRPQQLKNTCCSESTAAKQPHSL